ncbi:hypothetical protein L596_002520 [Steinernema carpocapsae]|uniref:Uncharacterized protein n=1 Tax=Steinernema carpocapsae TaxID=34508 RepID=A0A4U8UPF0_STECR|nr:hypothetical protein L596_002520 [Steinernema carpocapsae]
MVRGDFCFPIPNSLFVGLLEHHSKCDRRTLEYSPNREASWARQERGKRNFSWMLIGMWRYAFERDRRACDSLI